MDPAADPHLRGQCIFLRGSMDADAGSCAGGKYLCLCHNVGGVSHRHCVRQRTGREGSHRSQSRSLRFRINTGGHCGAVDGRICMDGATDSRTAGNGAVSSVRGDDHVAGNDLHRCHLSSGSAITGA